MRIERVFNISSFEYIPIVIFCCWLIYFLLFYNQYCKRNISLITKIVSLVTNLLVFIYCVIEIFQIMERESVIYMNTQTAIPAIIVSLAVFFFLIAVIIHVGLDMREKKRSGMTAKSNYVSDILLIIAAVALMVMIIAAIVQIYSLS